MICEFLRLNSEVVQLANFQYSAITIRHHKARVRHSLGITSFAIGIECDATLPDKPTCLALALYNASLGYKCHNICWFGKHIFRHILGQFRSEERRVGKECRSRWS